MAGRVAAKKLPRSILSIPDALRNGRAMLALILLELIFILLLSFVPISQLLWFRSIFDIRVTGLWFAGLLALTVLALPRTSNITRRYRQNGRLRPVPFVPGVDAPLVLLELLACAWLPAVAFWPIELWRATAFLFFPSILVLFGVPLLSAGIRQRPAVRVPLATPADSLDFRDNPIVGHEQDLLDRDDLIGRWCASLRSTSREAATLYGFYGPQGGGKTSFLNLLQKLS